MPKETTTTRSSKQRQDNTHDDECVSTRGSGMLHMTEELVRKFSGTDDDYSVTEWIEDIEENGDVFRWSPTQRLLVARRSLTGTAALWLRAEKTFKTWDDLQVAISKEFPDTTDAKRIHELLSSRRKGRSESCLDYMLTMKAIGERGKLPDYVTIKYIVEGIVDDEVNKMMLYGVTTYTDLKEKLKIYEVIAAKTKATEENRQMQVKAGNGGNRSKTLTAQGTTRCYSCGEKNHMSAMCPHSDKGRKCFNCNEFGHLSVHCKVARKYQVGSHSGRNTGNDRSPNSNEVYMNSTEVGATVYEEAVLPATSFIASTGNGDSLPVIGRAGNMADDVDEVGKVHRNDFDFDSPNVNKQRNVNFNVKMPVKCIEIQGKSVATLIDSGSDVNLITDECLRRLGVLKYDDNVTITIVGLGLSQTRTLGSFTTPICIDGSNYDDVVFHIVPKQCMTYKLILGNEFLRKVVTVMQGGSVWVYPTSEWLYDVNRVCVSDVLDHMKDAAAKDELTRLVESDDQPCQTKEAPIELQLTMKDDNPVAKRPHCISIKEKKDAKRYELLKEENGKSCLRDSDELRKLAKKMILRVQDENQTNYDKRRKKSRKYREGDLVAIQLTQFGPGLKPRAKYLGPYRVLKVKRNDRYDVEKSDLMTEGPNKISASADHMKGWPV